MSARILRIGLLIALAISIGLNVLLFKRARAWYVELHAVRLDPLGLASFAHATVDAGRRPVVMFGDSRIAEWPAPPCLSNVVNRGIGSQTTAQLLGRLSNDVLSLQPDLVILQAGVNDLKTLPLFPSRSADIVAQCRSNLAQIVQQLVAHDARVIVTTIFPLGEIPPERRPFWSPDVARAIIEVNTFLRTLENDAVRVLDTANVLGDAGVVDVRYSRDLLHLSEDGYHALNRALVESLEGWTPNPPPSG